MIKSNVSDQSWLHYQGKIYLRSSKLQHLKLFWREESTSEGAKIIKILSFFLFFLKTKVEVQRKWKIAPTRKKRMKVWLEVQECAPQEKRMKT